MPNISPLTLGPWVPGLAQGKIKITYCSGLELVAGPPKVRGHFCLWLLATTPVPAPIRLCADFCVLYFLSRSSQNTICIVLCGRVQARLQVLLT